MSEQMIRSDSKIVKILVAQANKERIDSNVLADAEKLYADMYNNPTPENRYRLAQLVTYAVNEMLPKETNWRQYVADEKKVGATDEALFRVRNRGIKAFVLADGSTTPATRVSHDNVILPTVIVSVRPVVQLREMRAGKVNMSDLVLDATRELADAENRYVQNVLASAASSWASPFYGEGSGIVADTLNPMVLHWLRTGGATIVGDIAPIQKLAQLTGFTASTTEQQYSPDIINEFNRTGRIGSYNGASVVQFANSYDPDGITPVLSDKFLYVLPTGSRVEDRPLKVVQKGDVISVENTNIDDMTYEIRMDQAFGAGLAFGTTPEMSVYKDSTT